MQEKHELIIVQSSRPGRVLQAGILERLAEQSWLNGCPAELRLRVNGQPAGPLFTDLSWEKQSRLEAAMDSARDDLVGSPAYSPSSAAKAVLD